MTVRLARRIGIACSTLLLCLGTLNAAMSTPRGFLVAVFAFTAATWCLYYRNRLETR
jgi:hypothetical protein